MESAPTDGKVSKGTGELLARGAPSQPPPGMDDGGQYQPVTQPPAQPGTRMAPPAQQQIDATVERMQNRQAPRMIGDRPEDIDPQTGKEKTSAKLSSWGQRLGLALLAATKLAPYAQQIIHPQYSQQMDEYKQGQAQDATLLKGQETAENTKSIAENRKAQELLRQSQADPHYGMVPVDPAFAPAIMPDANGEVWVPKSAAAGLTKPAPVNKLVPVPANSRLYDPESRQVLLDSSPSPKTITNLTEKWISDNPTGTAEDLRKFLEEQRSDQLRPTITDLGLRAEAGIITGNHNLDIISPEEAKKAIDATKEKPGEEGTWQIAEGTDGSPVLFNSKTSQTKPISGIQKAGTKSKADAALEKAIGPSRDAAAYANDYVKRGVYTGPGDEALMEKFFELAKPSTGFRMSQQQIDMLKNAQSFMNSVGAKIRHATVGTWFSDDLRNQIVGTMNDLANAKQAAHTATPGGAVEDPKGEGICRSVFWWRHRKS